MKKEAILVTSSKRRSVFSRTIFASALICASAHSPLWAARKLPAPAADRQVAFVGTAIAKSMTGQVEYLSGKNWLPATVGQVFSCDQLCRTDRDAKAVFQMRSSGSFVRVGGNTMVRFCALDETMPACSLTGYEAADGRATVRAVRGAAEYMDKQSKWQSLRVNSMLPAGTAVRTLNKTTVDLFFADSGLVMRINPHSQVILNPTPQVLAGEIQTNRKTQGLLAQVDSQR